MREILFRGQTRKRGEKVLGGSGEKLPGIWVYGGIFPQNKGGSYSIIYTYDPIDKKIVYADTVGQYTGLTDKNGAKIFEGDIVRIVGNQDVEDWKSVNYTALIAFLDGGFCAIDGIVDEHAFRRYALCRMDFDIEVIGNIHDNPELLEGE